MHQGGENQERLVDTRISDLEARVRALEDRLRDSPVGFGQKKESISEFVRALSPGSDVEKTLVIAYFLEHVEGIAPFNARDIEDGYLRAKEPRPGNVNETVNKNIRKGYLMEMKTLKNGMKAWSVTNSGDSHVVELRRSSTDL